MKKPDQLSETELEMEMPPRILRPIDPYAPKNTVAYSFRTCEYILADQVSQMITHVSKRGTLSRINGDTVTPVHKKEPHSNREVSIELNPQRSQFYFTDRGSQTEKYTLVNGSVSTIPPPSREYNGLVTSSIINERYGADSSSPNPTSNLTNGKVGLLEDSTGSMESPEDLCKSYLNKKKVASEIEPVYSDEMKKSAKLMERILNYNSEADVYLSIEDDSVGPASTHPALHALWVFVNAKSKNKQVTCLKWNPEYPDLFAVSFGSYEYLKQGSGVVGIYSLKNTKFPEFLYTTTCTVCCLDWHPKRTSLLVVGMYDGNVGIYDLRNHECKNFVFASLNSKYSEPISEIRWLSESSSRLEFTTISLDGTVSRWTVSRSRLECEVAFELISTSGDELSRKKTSNCLSFDVSLEDHVLVGTEEGTVIDIAKYTLEREIFFGHALAVYSVKRNPFLPHVFLSCSADWMVNVWATNTGKKDSPLCKFDVGQSAVGDVDWSPLRSTVFAAVNGDGTVFVYDIETNRVSEIISQRIVKKGKLTRVAFNRSGTGLIVGDDRGSVYSMKVTCGGWEVVDKEIERLRKVINILSS